ncbi:hypothetical protein EV702DRAFT_1044816 [Suillus placidus]|uniref:Uncharacterized protein n=1 Tax=Suillus placidus TaxID=48579 RepID=A0A9P7D2S5_9AGAM|nr:hypothetical protein EV702DRAFT_1044816 [Suillus placidus]
MFLIPSNPSMFPLCSSSEGKKIVNLFSLGSVDKLSVANRCDIGSASIICIEAKTLKEQVGLIYPCGFCGQSGHDEHKIQIKILNKGVICEGEDTGLELHK